MKKRVILTFIYLFITNCTYISTKLIKFNNLPQPTGLYTVGTSQFFLTDSSRKGWYNNEDDGPRRLMIQVWYPSNITIQNNEPYMDRMDERIPAMAMEMGLPSFTITNMETIQSNSSSNIKSANGNFPIILFSHGLGGMRSQNSVQAEELASQGYIVFSPDHMYDANISIYPDGTTASYNSNIKNENKNNWISIRRKQLEYRLGDIQFILNQIQSGNIPSQLVGKIDLNNIGIFGHSFGGATSIISSIIASPIINRSVRNCPSSRLAILWECACCYKSS